VKLAERFADTLIRRDGQWKVVANHCVPHLMRIDVNRRNPSSWRKQAWGVEKLHFLQNSKNLGDRKCLGKLRKPFVGHPDTILFWRISRERVFQHPQAFTPTTLPRPPIRG
jgi:hypothetical protein